MHSLSFFATYPFNLPHAYQSSSNPTDVFQEAMKNQIPDLEKVFVYMDDIIIIGDATFEVLIKM